MPDWGAVIPEDLPLGQLPAWLEEIRRLGWSQVWCGEVAGRDAFASLASCAAHDPDMQLGAIVPASTRGPGLLAMSIATLSDLAPGRVTVALGASSPQVLGGWNDRPTDLPYTRLRATFEFLQAALPGERVSKDFGPFTVDGFRLAAAPAVPPELLVAGLGPRTLAMAAEKADGVLLNWLSPNDVPALRATQPDGARLATLAYYAPGEDERDLARRLLVAYANVPAYAQHHRRLGRSDALQPVWDAWASGDRRAALAALPDRLLDELVVSGTPAACRARLTEYLDAGLDTVVVHVLSPGSENLAALHKLGSVS